MNARPSPRALAPLLLLLLGACQSAGPSGPAHVELTNERTARAEVLAVAPAQRLVTLRHEDGRVFLVRAGAAVRNFDEIKAGDELRVRYREKLAATRLAAGEGARPLEGALAAGRAPAGAKPAGELGLSVRLSVVIESIDLENDIVVFSLASGELIAHRIATPEGRAFVRGLQRGDTVQLDYDEALALSIEEL